MRVTLIRGTINRKGGSLVLERKMIDGALKQKRSEKDKKLESLNPRGFYWFAWSKFNPDTGIYNIEK